MDAEINHTLSFYSVVYFVGEMIKKKSRRVKFVKACSNDIKSKNYEGLFTKLSPHVNRVIQHGKNAISFFTVVFSLLSLSTKNTTSKHIDVISQVLSSDNHPITRMTILVEMFPFFPREIKFITYLKIMKFGFVTGQKQRFENFAGSLPFERILQWMTPFEKIEFFKMYSTILKAKKKISQSIDVLMYILHDHQKEDENDKEVVRELILLTLETGDYRSLKKVHSKCSQAIRKFSIPTPFKFSQKLYPSSSKNSKGNSPKRQSEKRKSKRILQQEDEFRRKELDRYDLSRLENEEHLVLSNLFFFVVKDVGQRDQTKEFKTKMKKKEWGRVFKKWSNRISSGLIHKILDEKSGKNKNHGKKKKGIFSFLLGKERKENVVFVDKEKENKEDAGQIEKVDEKSLGGKAVASGVDTAVSTPTVLLGNVKQEVKQDVKTQPEIGKEELEQISAALVGVKENTEVDQLLKETQPEKGPEKVKGELQEEKAVVVIQEKQVEIEKGVEGDIKITEEKVVVGQEVINEVKGAVQEKKDTESSDSSQNVVESSSENQQSIQGDSAGTKEIVTVEKDDDLDEIKGKFTEDTASIDSSQKQVESSSGNQQETRGETKEILPNENETERKVVVKEEKVTESSNSPQKLSERTQEDSSTISKEITPVEKEVNVVVEDSIPIPKEKGMIKKGIMKGDEGNQNCDAVSTPQTKNAIQGSETKEATELLESNPKENLE